MRKFHSIAALCATACVPNCKHCSTGWQLTLSRSYSSADGMTQAGPDPASETESAIPIKPKRVA